MTRVGAAAQAPVGKWALRIYALVFPLALFFVLEGMNPASQAGLMMAPFSNLGIIFVSALFIALVALAIFSFSGSVFWSYAAVSFILTLGYVTNNVKLLITGQVFVPTDLLVVREAFMVGGGGSIVIERTLILRLFIVAILHLPLLFLKFRPKFKKRIIILPCALAVFFLTFASGFSASTLMPALGINPIGSMTALYRDTGFILGFHASLVDHVTRDAGVISEYMAAMGFPDDVPMQSEGHYIDGERIRPNVIVIMSEAFMDPAVIYNLEFSVDPAANFRRLSDEHISGNVIVPVFGGGTANTELELLTGSAMFFMGNAYYIPYSNTERYFFRNVTTAMPWVFRENGYRTVAVHPYTRYFFNRHINYPRLGFDQYVAYEDMDDPVYKGWYVSDEFFTDMIIEQILLAEQTDEPLFLFGISMQNHWEFWEYKYEGFPQDVTARSPYLSDAELGQLNAYLQGIYDADKQLGRLIDFIEARDTPTIVVFFGDHLPIIGSHSDAVFERLGYISDQRVWMWNEEDRRKMFEVPYLVWSNFAPADEDWGTVSTYFLGAQLLRHSGIELNRYWWHVLWLSEQFSALSENHYVDIHGVFHGLHGVRDLPHVQSMQALQQAKWFGGGAFLEYLSEIVG